jgi:hypothetical protein
MTDPNKRLRFSGPITVQFRQFRQGLMQTDADGDQTFIGMVDGIFGVPPNGARFEAQVKLSVGASFTEDAYEVVVPEALAELGARPEFRRAAYEYVDMCMSSMVGPQWAQMTGMLAQNNLFQIPGPAVVVTFEDGSASW